MKLATYSHGGTAALGVVQGDRVHPISGLPDNEMATLAGRFDEFRPQVEAALKVPGLPLSEVRLLPPVTRPNKIMAIGLNYADHIRESSMAWPEQQTWFCKQISALSGPYDPIEVPKVSTALDYEAELVAVIGKGGRHISKEDAPKHVFGYCVGNDVSVRDWQLATSQWVLGKSFDTHAPIGPWITTADEIGDPHRLDIRCFVNGELRQNSNTRELVFNVWDQISRLSGAMTLKSGDLIFTGTPSGVGGAMKPPKHLKHGDKVRVEIAELGAIENTCENEA
jgi:2-keto-4-pentenoate hydratase/2-oxohepta-3-ene-1,7-dioic acid hydratase in catechol pathway